MHHGCDIGSSEKEGVKKKVNTNEADEIRIVDCSDEISAISEYAHKLFKNNSYVYMFVIYYIPIQITIYLRNNGIKRVIVTLVIFFLLTNIILVYNSDMTGVKGEDSKNALRL
jgi:hypothetical protein